MKSWSEQYKDPRWQKKRLELFEENQYTCVMCGQKEEQLHAHHVKYDYKKKVWEYDDLLCLCDTCHTNIHIHKSLINKELEENPFIYRVLASVIQCEIYDEFFIHLLKNFIETVGEKQAMKFLERFIK